MEERIEGKDWIKPVARTGYIAKGIVYLILGLLAFMAAFEMGGQKNAEATTSGVFDFVRNMPGGVLLLVLLAAGLICYSTWRGVQVFAKNNHHKDKWTKTVRYAVSGLAYLSLAYTAIQMAFNRNTGGGDQNQDMAAMLLSKWYGEWLLGAAALIMAATGVYQIYYGLSERYKQHVQQIHQTNTMSTLLLRSGKIGYIARGIVWLIIAYLLLQAVLHASSSEAGNSGKAFQLVEGSSYGSYLLGAIGLGLAAYGVFNFIRARYERFD